MKSSDLERLDSLLDEWQPRLRPSDDFSTTLRQRLRERRHRARTVWGIAAAASAAALLAGFIYLGPLRPAPAARTVEQIAVVQDLQLLNNNAELIEHLDFLSLPPSPPASIAGPD